MSTSFQPAHSCPIPPRQVDAGFSAADPVALRAQALRCRRLADSVCDPRTLDALSHMADDYEARARRLETGRKS